MSESISLNFGNAGVFDKSYRGLQKRLRNGELRKLARTFEANCDRVQELGAAHIDLVVCSLWMARADRDLRHKLGVPLDHPTPADWQEFSEGMDAAWAELDGYRQNDPNYNEQFWRLGTFFIEGYINSGRIKPHGSAGILASMMMSGWMCFECLSVDVWKTMVNSSPIPLARNVLKGQPPPGNDLSSREQKTLNTSVLERYGFDLSTKMGDVLVNQRKVNLDSFAGIQHAYKTAFSKDWDEEIWVEAEWISWHEAIRNLYAHRGGYIDESFIRRARGMQTHSPLRLGQEFTVTGDNVRDYMSIVVQSAVKLLEFADEWTDRNSSETGGAGPRA